MRPRWWHLMDVAVVVLATAVFFALHLQPAGAGGGECSCEEGEAGKKQFHAGAEPVILTAELSPPQQGVVSVGSYVIECQASVAQYTGSVKTLASISLPVEFGPCELHSGENVIFKMNGCSYTVSPTGTLDVECPEKKEIEIKINEKCTVVVPAQKGLSSVNFDNTGKKEEQDVDATVSISGLEYIEGAGESCSNPGPHNDGAMNETWTVRAFEDSAGKEGKPVSLLVE